MEAEGRVHTAVTAAAVVASRSWPDHPAVDLEGWARYNLEERASAAEPTHLAVEKAAQPWPHVVVADREGRPMCLRQSCPPMGCLWLLQRQLAFQAHAAPVFSLPDLTQLPGKRLEP